MHDLGFMEVQDFHARVGSTEVEDSIAVSQSTAPVRSLSPVGAPSSSPLSSIPSSRSSPTYVKTEDDGGGVEAGPAERAPAAPIARPRKGRHRLDPCADGVWVDVLNVPDTNPDLQITDTVRKSERIRDSVASKSSGIGASSKISPPSTRPRPKRTVKHPVKPKEEAGHNLGSPGISEDAETFSSSVSNGVQQASSRDAPAFPKSTLKRKHEEEGQNLDLPIADSAHTISATKTGLERVRAMSLPFGCVDKPGTSYTGAERARCRSMDKDPGGLGQLTELHGLAGKDTMHSNDQLETVTKPATKSARRKLGGDKYSSSITNEAGGDESSSASNGVLNSSSDSESTVHTDVEDENYQGGVVDEGPSSCAALSIIKAPEDSGGPAVRDSRVNKDAFWLVDGVLCIPYACDFCYLTHNFCDRAQPCGKCQRSGNDCVRRAGWAPARPKQQRNKRADPDTRTPEASPSRGLETLSLQSIPNKKRGRPRKSDVKSEIVSEIKETKKVKPLLWSPIDFQKDKAPGISKPEVWCETRQELCESLPYYRSYQAGCYGHDGLMHGYLLDGFASPRDYISSKVVISHSGGKSGTDDSGQRRLLTDQTIDDNTIKYLIKNMNQKWPLVLIMGNQCTNSPSKIPHRYCVMDWFKVTAAWAEKDSLSQCTRWKFRFEKLNTNSDGWWAATASEELNPPQEMAKASCLSCEKESPHIYNQGWACLNPDCESFWMLNNADMPTELTYTENFLNCRTPWPEDFLQPPNSLAPPLDTEPTAHVESGGVSRPFWKGMCCPKCGRLSCRELWAGWLCPTCGHSHNPPRVIFDAARLADPHRPVYTGPAIPSNHHNEEITSKRFVRDGMTVVQYQLGDCGTVTHILANKASNSGHESANWLLENYQNRDMPFRRFPMKCHHSQGRLLTQQFMYNCGAPYKFIVDVNSSPFEDSPPVVLKALRLIHQRAQLVHPEARFNEVLNVGYFEKQKMDYHDDGEEGLGETVASISLGGSARMKFRVKSKYRDDRHCWTTEPEKHSQDAGSGNSIYNDENMEDEEEENPGEMAAGLQTNASSMRAKGRSNKAMLDLCLNHGDVMVMKGAGIQTHWEHTVVPTGLFRIAATARYIAHSASGSVPKIQSTRTDIGGDDSTLPLTDSKPIKAEGSTMNADDTQTISMNGLDEPNQPGVTGENPDFSQSVVNLHGPGFTTSPFTAVSQETSPIPIVPLTRRDSPGPDTYTQSIASHHLPFTQNMLTKPVPPLETTAPHTPSDHQVQLVPYSNYMGPPYTPVSTNQPGSYPWSSPEGFTSSYYLPTPTQTTPYRPSPFGRDLTENSGNPFIVQPQLGGQIPPRHSFGSYPSHDYPPPEAYGASEKMNGLRNTFNAASQRSNAHQHGFSSSVQAADGFQNALASSRAQTHLSNNSTLFQGYNSNGKTENPASNSTSTFTTDNANKGYAQSL